MPANRFSYGGISNDYAPYRDFEFNTDDPNEYWVMTYDAERAWFYAHQRKAEDLDGWFETERAATPQEVAELLSVLPVNQLPPKAFLQINKVGE